MKDEDWSNLRLQLKTLVDIYCEMNNDIVKMKDLMKKMVKVMCSKQIKEKSLKAPVVKSQTKKA